VGDGVVAGILTDKFTAVPVRSEGIFSEGIFVAGCRRRGFSSPGIFVAGIFVAGVFVTGVFVAGVFVTGVFVAGRRRGTLSRGSHAEKTVRIREVSSSPGQNVVVLSIGPHRLGLDFRIIVAGQFGMAEPFDGRVPCQNR